MADGAGQRAQDPWPAWWAAAARCDVDAALRVFYDELDAAVARGNAVCHQSGRCCKFDAFGHRLYVTALEIAWFLRQTDEPDQPPAPSLPVLPARDTPACPYQRDNLCTVYTVRPLGCRVFFCQSGAEAWQQDLYERFLARLKAIHHQFNIPYRYLEWRAGLDEARAAIPAMRRDLSRVSH